MAAGDVFNQLNAGIAAGGTITVRPDSGEEVTITNILTDATAITITLTNGVTNIQVDQGSGWYGLSLKLTNAFYMTITNNDTSAKNVWVDGMVTKG